MCFSKAIPSYNSMCFSFHPMAYNESPYDWLAYHRYRWVASVLLLTCFIQHLFRLVVHSLSFRRSVLGSTTAALLDHISRDWGDFTVVLVELRWTLRGFQISSTAAMVYTFISSRHHSHNIVVWKNFRKVRKISVLFKSAIKSCDSPLNLLSSAFGSSPERMMSYVCGCRTSRSGAWPCSHVLYPAARMQKDVLQILCNPRCCYQVPP